MNIVATGLSIALTAQVVVGSSTSAAAQGPQVTASSCSLMVAKGDGFEETPLPRFDPSKPQPLIPPQQASEAKGIVCNRASIIPARADLRVLTELHVPLAIVDGQRAGWLIMVNGQLAFNFVAGQVSSEEAPEMQARLDQLQADYNRQQTKQ